MNDKDEKKQEQRQEIKVVVKSSLTWAVLWLVGMLFTVGFCPYPSGLSLGQQAGKWFLYVFVWPLILGQKLAG
jgi:hypothetical protein